MYLFVRNRSYITDLRFLVLKISKKWYLVIHISVDIISQIFLDRVNTAGTVNASQTEASKAEEDFKNLQEQKKAQDLYLNKLSKDMEDLEQKALEYQSQVTQKENATKNPNKIRKDT